MAPLVRLLRVSPGPAAAVAEAVRGADPGVLVAEAIRHGLAGLVLHVLHGAGVELPPPHGETLRGQAMTSVGIGMQVKRLLLRALDALAAEGITPVLLKGYGLGLRLYPEPFLRASSDVDLWVERAELDRAERVLSTKLGLARVEEAGEVDFEEERLHHLQLAGKAGIVELHYRPLSSFGSALEGEGYRARGVKAEVEGRPLWYLGPEDELVYLAVHATHHMLQRLSWLHDLKLFALKHPALDWDEVVAKAKAERMAGLAYFALDAARRLLDAPIPEAALARLRPARWQAALARRVFSEAWLGGAFLAEHKAVWYAAKALLAQDVRRTARMGLLRLYQAVRERAVRSREVPR
ncbi:MAG TPA: nucleotidyltransferase family protein [Longimicrobium sp.]|nr:nucleotidyltransferase family protein [Longimicrobium sp.]